MRVDVIMPQMGESIAEGTLTKWLKKAGDKVARDEPIFEISTDKVDAEIPAPAAGTLVEVKVKEGETVPVNTVVALIETEAGAAVGAGSARPAAAPAAPQPAAPAPAPAAKPSPAAASRPAPSPAAQRATAPALPEAAAAIPRASELAASGASVDEMRRARSSPVVRKMAREHDIDISRIPGTGVGGRVTRRDVEAALQSGGAPAAPGPSFATP